MPPSRKTRRQASRPIFGLPKELSGNVLPTYSDVIKFYFWVQNINSKNSSATTKSTVNDITKVVASRVEEIWNKASIPIVSHDRVLQILRSYYDKYLKLLKPYKKRQSQIKYQKQLNSFKEEAHSRLFDIAACKCDFTTCSCDKARKVPVCEQTFLIDQRSMRLMFISNIDKAVSEKLKCKYKRKLASATRIEKYKRSVQEENRCKVDDHQEAQDESDDDIPLAKIRKRIQSEEYVRTSDEVESNLMLTSVSDNRLKTPRLERDLPTLARACDRHGVSDRAAAAIASAALQDFGIISPDDSQNVVDRNKIRRARQRKRNLLQKMNKDNRENLLQTLYFDGRKDHTMTNVQKGSKWYRKNVVEEHLTLLEEPGSQFIGHVTPASGSSEDIKNSLLDFLNERYDLGYLLVSMYSLIAHN